MRYEHMDAWWMVSGEDALLQAERLKGAGNVYGMQALLSRDARD